MTMRKYTLNDESKVLDYFRESSFRVLPIPHTKGVESTYELLTSKDFWKEWVDTSAKDKLPPDFYNPKEKVMLEVMSFDDKAQKNGKLNVTKARESKLLDEIKKTGIMENNPKIKEVVVLADSGLSTGEDHNFERYINNFKRVIDKHAKKVENYKQTHPGYSLVFFVFDESSGIYFENKANVQLNLGDGMISKPHLYWMDDDLVSSIQKCNADYVVWFKPYNSFRTIDGVIDDFPKIIIYEVGNIDIETQKYLGKNMTSSEV